MFCGVVKDIKSSGVKKGAAGSAEQGKSIQLQGQVTDRVVSVFGPRSLLHLVFAFQSACGMRISLSFWFSRCLGAPGTPKTTSESRDQRHSGEAHGRAPLVLKLPDQHETGATPDHKCDGRLPGEPEVPRLALDLRRCR